MLLLVLCLFMECTAANTRLRPHALPKCATGGSVSGGCPRPFRRIKLLCAPVLFGVRLGASLMSTEFRSCLTIHRSPHRLVLLKNRRLMDLLELMKLWCRKISLFLEHLHLVGRERKIGLHVCLRDPFTLDFCTLGDIVASARVLGRVHPEIVGWAMGILSL